MTTVRRWTGHEASVLRRALRMSIRGFAAHLGVAARTVSKWEEHGTTTSPLPDTQAILDEALSRADNDAKRRFELFLSEDSDEKVEDVNRRTLLALLGPVATSPFAGRMEELRRGLDGMLGTEPADRDAADWEETVAGYACEVGSTPAIGLLPNLIADFSDIQASIAQSRGSVRKRLIHSTSQLAALTAITLVNAGERHAAQRWWRTATHAAAATADPTLTALVRGRHAVMSLYNGPPDRVLELGERAVAAGGSTPSVGVISGFAARAQALSQLGRHDESARTLHSVLDMFPHLPDGAAANSSSQWNWGPQRLHHVTSHVHAYAGQTDDASAAQDAALAAYPSQNFQGRSQIEFHRAIGLIRAGDIDTGVSHLMSTIDHLEPWQREDGIIKRSAMMAIGVVPYSHRDRSIVKRAEDSIKI